MLTLGLDTTTAWGSVGLYNGHSLGEISLQRHARRDDPLLPSVEHLLTQAQIGKSDIELIAVALGPGSFTGLRVGVSLAKGMSMGFNIPVVGVPSTPMLADRVSVWPGVVCALVSDRKDRAYVAWYRQGAEQKPVEAMALEQLQSELEGFSEPVLIVGPGSELLHTHLRLPDTVQWATKHLCQPSGLSVAQTGFEKFQRNGADDGAFLEPVYCAPPAIDPGVFASTR